MMLYVFIRCKFVLLECKGGREFVCVFIICNDIFCIEIFRRVGCCKYCYCFKDEFFFYMIVEVRN